jgi:PKD repeat protein
VSDSRLSDSETIGITVSLTNTPPVANAGGTYFGVVDRALRFNGGGSFDPDGDALTYAWNFGDGKTAGEANPQHTYLVEGNFLATLTVCDDGTPQLCGTDVAAVTIQTEVGATIILRGSNTRLDARKDDGGGQKLALEEVLLPYTDLDPASLRISTTLPGAGSVSECAADPSFFKFTDSNLNGVADIQIQFPNTCIHDLFEFTLNGSSATIVITGQFVDGSGTTPLHAERVATIRTRYTGQNVSALAYPNPFNPETAISYTVRNNGPVTMRIYSVDGRLVRTLKNGEQTVAGTHEVRWNGVNEQGRHMPSGVYFVRTSQRSGNTEETSTLKLAITK